MRCSRRGTLVLLITLVECVRLCLGKTCLLVYQMADNNLEYYLRKDFEEITLSPAVQGDDLRTWVYHDARNEGIGEPLPNTVDANGNAVTAPFFGSRYMTYDKDLQKMRIDVQLSGEVNSDQPETVQNFLEYGIQDCLAHNYTSLMAAFSSHAGGFAGFGGDKATRRNLRELLKINLQTNRAIAGAIRAALDTTVGTDQKLEVLGFDACLMQATGSADDYRTVAKYILASEAVEPGHGE
jgi:Clostripain family